MYVHLRKEDFEATLDGKAVGLYTLKNKHGMRVSICNWGARIVQILVPDRDGNLDDIVWGYGDLATTRVGHVEMGAVIGRCTNRIAGARFELDGRSYPLAANDGENHIHGGRGGSMRAVFDTVRADEHSLELSYRFMDGEDGYPGNCLLQVRYTLDDANALTMELRAVTDAPTIVNFCNHTYFNLEGTDSSDIGGHVLEVFADAYTPIDAHLIPTGEIAGVEGSPLDFRTPHAIGERIDEAHEQLRRGRGYDHNYVLRVNDDPSTPRLAARLHAPRSGRGMTVSTTEPGIQLYTGNFLRDDFIGKGGRPMPRRSALCLETQHFPDAVNHPHFSSVVLRPGGCFISTTRYAF